MKLRKLPKYKAIVEDIIAYLKSGELKPGDHLRSYKDLMAAYKVSQAPVSRAFNELETMGLVERRRRAFCRVSMQAYARLKDLPHHTPHDTVGEDHQHTSIKRLVNYNPCSTVHTLRLFLTDGYPEHLQAWHDVLAEFERAHPGLSIRIDSAGKSAALEAASRADVIQAVPWFVHDLGQYGFVAADSMGTWPFRTSDLAPAAAQFASTNPPAPGTLFEIMPVALVINNTLAAASGRPLDLENVVTLLDTILCAIKTEPLRKKWGGHFGTLFGLLAHYGALFQTADGSFDCDEHAVGNVVTSYLKLASVPRGLWLGDDVTLLSGEILAYYGSLYLAIVLRRQRAFKWTMKPVPLSGRGRPLVRPIVLAVRSDSPLRRQAEDLVRHLCSLQSQIRFGMTGGSLPVLNDAIWHPEVQKSLPLDSDDLRRIVETGSVTWQITREQCFLEHELDKIGQKSAESRPTPKADDVMKKILDAIHAYRRSSYAGPHTASHGQLPGLAKSSSLHSHTS